MKKLFLIGTVVVLACAMWVSVHHTLDLFRAGGFTKGLEGPATTAAETAFIMGILSSFDSRRKGYKPHWSARLLFYAGLGVVGWSNVRAGIAYGWTGIILGVLIPVFLYLSESVLANAYIEAKRRKSVSDATDESVSVNKTVSDDDSVSVSVNDSVSRTVSASDDASAIVSGDDRQFVSVNESVSDSVSTDENVSVSNRDSAEVLAVITFDELANDDDIDSVSVNSDDRETVSLTTDEVNSVESVSDSVGEIVNAGKIVSESVSDKTVSVNKTVSKEIVSEKTVSTDDSESVSMKTVSKSVSQGNVVNFPSKTNRKKRDTAAEVERVKKIALRIAEETGELPGRPTLVREAGCSHHIAKKALDELKATG